MSTYTPDRWVLIEITNEEEIIYKIFGSWLGGYANGDAWRLNSGISNIEENDNCYFVNGESGSLYLCNKNSYGINNYSRKIIDNFSKKCEEIDCEFKMIKSKEDAIEILKTFIKN